MEYGIYEITWLFLVVSVASHIKLYAYLCIIYFLAYSSTQNIAVF